MPSGALLVPALSIKSSTKRQPSATKPPLAGTLQFPADPGWRTRKALFPNGVLVAVLVEVFVGVLVRALVGVPVYVGHTETPLIRRPQPLSVPLSVGPTSVTRSDQIPEDD